MKYKLHGGGKMHDGRKVYRIKALEDFGDVRVGDLGGYIESEGNLSQKSGDTSWVYDDSIVYGRGEVLGDSKVYKNAIIQDSRIEGDSRVSHGATIQHSRITGGSIVQDANVFYSRIEFSKVFADSDVKNSTVKHSEVSNGSKVYQSIIDRSTVRNDAHISGGSTIEGRTIDDESVKNNVLVAHVTLGADDLMDLEGLDSELEQ